MLRFIVFVLLCQFSLLLQAVTLDNTTNRVDPFPLDEFYVDEGTQADMLFKLTKTNKSQLQKIDNLSYVSGAFWQIVNIENQSQKRDWVLHVGDVLLSNVDVYVIGKTMQHVSATYQTLSFKDFMLPTGYALNLTLEPNQRFVIAVRLKGQLYDKVIESSIMPTAYFDKWAAQHTLLYLLIMGAVLGLAIYAIFLFFLTKDISYAWFGALTTVGCLILSFEYGYFYALIGLDEINRYIDVSIGPLYLLLLLAFSHNLLALKRSPKLNLGYWIYSIVMFLSLVFSASQGLVIFSLVTASTNLLTAVIVIATTILAIKKKKPAAWYLLLAWLPITVVLFAYFFMDILFQGYVPNIDIDYYWFLSIFLMDLILLLGVANKLNILQRDKRVAEKLSLEKSRFIAAASHDLRQPLHSMGLNVSLLEKYVKQEGLTFLEHIKTSLASANGLFGSVLDLSRLEAGVLKVDVQAIDLSQMLHELCKEFEPQAVSKSITIRFRTSDAWVNADELMLERILRNLISNALQHTENGGILLSTRMRQGSVLLQCWDTGCGMEQSALESVFSEYKQIKTKRLKSLDNIDLSLCSGQNLGLGLSIVKRFSTLLNISLTVGSKVGYGSVFSLLLPESEEESVQQTKEDTEFNLSQNNEFNYSIWLLDDDSEILEAMKATLESWGCHVVSALSWPLLQQKTNNLGTPDLLMVDLDLGGALDGFAVINRCKKKYIGLQSALITGNTAKEVLQKAKQQQITLLHKPLTPLKLRSLLQRL